MSLILSLSMYSWLGSGLDEPFSSCFFHILCGMKLTEIGSLVGSITLFLGCVCITIFDSQLSLFVEGHFSSYLQNKKT